MYKSFEFKLREADFGGFPKGLVYYMTTMDSWLYDKDPLMHLKYEHAIENKSLLTTNHFEELIKKYMLDNSYASLLTLKPEKGLAQREENELKEKLENYKNI